MNVNLESFREYLDEYGLTKRGQSSYLNYFKNFCFLAPIIYPKKRLSPTF